MRNHLILVLTFSLFILGITQIANAAADSYTTLLIQSDTMEGSQVFSDASSSSHTITPVGNVRHSTAQKVVGASSISFDGNSSHLKLAGHEAWQFDSQDFTIDFWYNPSRYHNTYEILMHFGPYASNLQLERVRSELRKGTFEIRIGTIVYTTDYVPDHIGIWAHLAIVRSGEKIYVFVNGKKRSIIMVNRVDVNPMDSIELAPNKAIIPSGEIVDLYIGRDPIGNYPFLGHLDEIRISKGIARWTADFTPPVPADTTIAIVPDSTSPVIGDSLCFDVNIADAAALYSAAFDLTYDPAVLQYVSAAEGNFLNSDGNATFFNAALLNGEPASGIVVVGVSRVADIGTVAGSGTIASACFSVVGGSGGNVTVGMENGHFEGTEPGSSIEIGEGDDPVVPVDIGMPQNLVVSDPATLDRLDLSWDAAPDASGYEIYRSVDSGGTFALLGQTDATTYQDADCILTGVPYYYKVKAIAAIGSSTGAFSNEASGTAAGLEGDINRDNRVDGKDLAILARAFGSDVGDAGYNCQANLDRTGPVDGDDLVILSGRFGDKL
ncbi:MAG: LamG-like jellyroll fold domain-containing protein [Desulfobacter sp.]